MALYLHLRSSKLCIKSGLKNAKNNKNIINRQVKLSFNLPTQGYAPKNYKAFRQIYSNALLHLTALSFDFLKDTNIFIKINLFKYQHL